jgi:hypothetical protein
MQCRLIKTQLSSVLSLCELQIDEGNLLHFKVLLHSNERKKAEFKKQLTAGKKNS